MSHYYITHCCKNKTTANNPVKAIERYLASYILYVQKLAKLEEKNFLIFSGKYGLLKSEDKIPYYDKLLKYDDFTALNPIVDNQIKNKTITKITFFHINTKYDEKVKVYVDFIKLFAERNNIDLDLVGLNPTKLILPRNIENDILKNEIKKIKQDKKVLIISHILQKQLLKDISDYVCDTYEMIRITKESNITSVLVCGVTYMSELVAIYNPKKVVLQPRYDAVCRYTDDLDDTDVKDIYSVFKKSAIIAHISTNLKVKLQSDYITDTEHLPKLVNEIDNDSIIIIGGGNIAEYAGRFTDKTIVYNHGICMPCSKITVDSIHKFLESNNILKNNIKILVTPDCDYSSFDCADEILTNSQIIDYIKQSNKKNFLICSEINLYETLKNEFPDKNFYQPANNLICNDMHRIKLINVYNTLIDFKNMVTIPDNISENIDRKSVV